MKTFPFRRTALVLFVSLAAAATAQAGANEDRKLHTIPSTNITARSNDAASLKDEQPQNESPVLIDADQEKKMQEQREERLKEFMKNYSAAVAAPAATDGQEVE